MKRRKLKLIAPIIILIILLFKCQHDPYADRYLTEKPKKQDVVGFYQLTEQNITEENLDFLEGKQSTIELYEDSTYQLVNYPDWMNIDEQDSLPELITDSGTWYIDKVGSIYHGDDESEDAWGIRFSGINSAHLTNNQPPYGLIFTYGDPDAGDVMIYEYKAENRKQEELLTKIFTLHGKTREEVIEELGEPKYSESYTVGEARGEFRVELYNTYPLTDSGNLDVPIQELWWEDGDYYITLWLHQVNGEWVVLNSYRWHKDLEF
ncbi:MAG: hypothetical protein ACP5FK_09920 [bacterium]